MQGQLSEFEKESLTFLNNDFNQCFQQMRYYDSQMIDILKFMFAAYTALIGIAIGAYQFGLKEDVDLTIAVMAAISVALLLGEFMFFLIIRNRVYFVQVARYVNEQREHFLKYKPMGFDNKSRMFSNHMHPPYFNWRSSQTILFSITATLNSSLIGMIVYFVCNLPNYYLILTVVVAFLLQILYAVTYLKSREHKSSSKSVLGKD